MLSLSEANALTGFRQGMRERNPGLARADNKHIELRAFTHETYSISLQK